jgi:hypothetical protein
MAQPTIQTSFASGEWAPKLRSRVDIQKYKAGAALLRNFYVDYAGGGASTRPGTRFINQAFNSALPVRLIPFQPSANLSYVLEFGHSYIRFFSNGAPILEPPTTISGVTNANPGVITDTAHGYANGDWVFLTGIGGTVQLNNNYYIVQSVAANTFTLTDLNGNAIDTTLFGVYTSGGTAQRVYTLASPYAATDLFPNPITGNPGIKFVQNVTSLIICHQSYPVYVLTINSAASWTITAANFGATIAAPATPSFVTTLGTSANGWQYAYTVTAVDINGQESTAPTPVFSPTGASALKSLSDSANPGTNTITWVGVPGAQSYNIYKASPIFGSGVTFPGVTPVGFVANVLGISWTDTTPGIAPDFSQTPPIGQNPFIGAGVQSYIVTTPGTYTLVPSVTVDPPPGSGYQATAQASLGVTVATINNHNVGSFGDILLHPGSPSPVNSLASFANGVVLQLTSVTFAGNHPGGDYWNVNTAIITSPGSITSGSTPSNPRSPSGCSAVGFISFAGGPTIRWNFTWGVVQLIPTQPGAGYDPTSLPAVTFSPVGAVATAVLGTTVGGNPGCPGFVQERLVLASQAKAVQSINMSQPGSFFNFNVSFPIEADDGISTQIISAELNDVRSLTQVPAGLLAMTGRAGWLINGGAGISTQDPITPANITAQPQGYNGANDLNPLKINFDILYGTKKGSYIRDLSYNLWAQIFVGSDISTLANHLFFNFFLTQWCWAEEPFKNVWAIRNDGTLLSLAYVKEQELQGWAHHDTNGQFQSVCSVLETVNGSSVDAVYFVVQRQIGANLVKYIERFADRFFPYGHEDAWSVDCALQTAPAFQFPGGLTGSGDASTIGNAVVLSDTTNSPFTSGMASGNWIVRWAGGIYKITAFTSSSQVNTTVVDPANTLDPYTNQPESDGKGYTIWQPVTSIGGLTQLVGQTVTGVADGVVVPSTVVSAPGNVTLSQAATKVTLGLPFTPQLQTLPLDLGEPTVQAKRKKVPALTMRVTDTLGLQAGTTFANVVTMKDFQLGAIPTQSNGPALVTDLFIGDGRQILDQVWQEPGQLCVQQNLPYPATILGIMPEVVVGDTPSARPSQ